MAWQDKLWIFFMQIGAHSGCHQRSDRSFSLGHYQFPICARCTGILIGEILGVANLFIGLTIATYLSIIFMLVMFLDWLIQKIDLLPSTNIRRILTGTLCGFGYFDILIKTIIHIIDYVI